MYRNEFLELASVAKTNKYPDMIPRGPQILNDKTMFWPGIPWYYRCSKDPVKFMVQLKDLTGFAYMYAYISVFIYIIYIWYTLNILWLGMKTDQLTESGVPYTYIYIYNDGPKLRMTFVPFRMNKNTLLRIMFGTFWL